MIFSSFLTFSCVWQLAAIKKLVSEVEEGDHAIFHCETQKTCHYNYFHWHTPLSSLVSGHGSQLEVKEDMGEIDGKDECEWHLYTCTLRKYRWTR